jgi:uncharacterized membrane protein YfcA
MTYAVENIGVPYARWSCSIRRCDSLWVPVMSYWVLMTAALFGIATGAFLLITLPYHQPASALVGVFLCFLGILLIWLMWRRIRGKEWP